DLKEQAAHADKDDIEIKACVEGTTQECSVTLSEHNGIVSCYYGVQSCHEGKWGECGGGEVVTMQATEDPVTGLALQALSSHKECANNPCDPSCRSFYEEPETSYEANKVEGEYHW